jgi:formylmethanofuran dehydrogenase subunit C
MSALNLTRHAVIRMSQRGIGLDDIALVEWIGTEVAGGHLVREKDFQDFERVLKSLRDQARRLVGKRIVREGAVVVTAYHARRREERRLLRTAARR